MASESYEFKKHPSQKVTEAQSVEKEWLGRGRYAEVTRDVLEVGKDGQERTTTLAIKKYFERKDVDETFLENLQKTHRKLRHLGLPSLPTFRLDKEKRTVATTDWTEGKTYDVGGYGNVHESEGTKVVTRIGNIDSLSNEMFSAAVLAGENHLEIAGDAYYFRFPRTGGEVDVDFVIGDIDGIIDPPVSSDDGSELARYNLESAHYALHWWTRNHIQDQETQSEYLKRIDDIYREKLEQQVK